MIGKEIIDFIICRLKEVKTVNSKNELELVKRHLRLSLETDLKEGFPDILYFYEFREKIDNFEDDRRNEIAVLNSVINLIDHVITKPEKNKKIIVLRKDLANLLKDSEIFNKQSINFDDIDDFMLWEYKIKEILDPFSFKTDIISTFIKNQEIDINHEVYYDGGSHTRILLPYFFDRLNKQRNLIRRIIKNLIEKGDTIISEVKNDKFKCFLTDTPECARDIKEKPNQVFIAYDYKDSKIQPIIDYIKEILKSQNLEPVVASDRKVTHDFMCKICQLIQESKFIIAEISNQNLNVGLELGIALGLQKKAILISNKNATEIGDLKRTDSVRYNENFKSLKKDIETMLKNIF